MKTGNMESQKMSKQSQAGLAVREEAKREAGSSLAHASSSGACRESQGDFGPATQEDHSLSPLFYTKDMASFKAK